MGVHGLEYETKWFDGSSNLRHRETTTWAARGVSDGPGLGTDGYSAVFVAPAQTDAYIEDGGNGRSDVRRVRDE